MTRTRTPRSTGFATARILHALDRMEPLIELFRQNEDDILQRVFASARRHGYTRYASTLVEAWRLSVRGLADALIEGLRGGTALDFGVDDDLSGDPLTRFGRESALRHRARGVTLAMFLGLTKYYRDAFADSGAAATDDPLEQARRRHLTSRLFDRIELGFCEAWSKADAATGSAALETENRALANEKNRHLAVLESILEAVYVLGPGGQVVYANPPALALALADPPVEPGAVHHGTALGQLNAHLPAWLPPLVDQRPGESRHVEVATPGGERTFVARVAPVLDVSGRAQGVVVVLRDLTELRQADRERQELQSVFDAVAGSAADGIVLTDAAGRIEFWNRAASELFGWSRDEALGRDARQLLGLGTTPLRAPRGTPPGASRHQAPHALRAQRRDGAWLDIELTLSHVPAGDQAHTLGIVRDVTARRRLELQAHTSARLEAVGRLAGGIAHEINTPVQFIGDSLHFLREATRTLCSVATDLQAQVAATRAEDPHAAGLAARFDELDLGFVIEEAPRALERAAEGVGRVADLVRAMKEFGFPGSGTMAPADLNRAVRNTLVVSRPSWKYVATVSFEEGPLPSVVCHVEQLSQVLLNLVVNAADAIRERGEGAPPGHIVVRTGLDGADALLQVEDSGVGIATEHQARLFQPFFTTKEPGRGTGQGLALSRHIVVETHHGALTFTSTPGVGSTFTVRVPVAGAPRAPSTAPTSLQAVG